MVPARGSRPACLGEPRGPQERDQPRTVEQFAVYAPMVQILDAPVPQLVEQLPDILHFFDTLTPVPEQVIEVPKIVLDGVPVRISVRDTQLVEQLVEVPTIISYASLLQRTMEQHVDIPVPGGGGRNAGLQGFPPEQSSTASGAEQIFDFSSGGGLQGFLPRQGSRSVNKIGDVPASGAGLQDFLPGQGPTAPFSSLERISETELWSRPLTFLLLVEVLHIFSQDRAHPLLLTIQLVLLKLWMSLGKGFFALFPKFKKVRIWVRTRVRECPGTSAHPRQLLITVLVSGIGS